MSSTTRCVPSTTTASTSSASAPLTGENPKAAYHGSRTATKLKVAGVDVAAIGLKAPERDTDEYVVFSEPKRGVYKSVIVRDDKLVGATLLGDVRKVAFLTQAFDNGVIAQCPVAGWTLQNQIDSRRM